MAVLAQQTSLITGVAVTYTAADVAGDTFPPNDRGMLRVKNGSGASINVTVAVPGNTRYAQADPDVVVAVAAGAEKMIGPFPPDLADPSDGRVHVTYSAVTTVTVAYTGV